MRFLVDTNLFISYLITPHNPLSELLELTAEGEITLIYPESLLEEIREVASRDKFRRYFSIQALDILIETIIILGEEIPKVNERIPRITRDAKDDYLLTYAVIGRANFLVTGDRDLLVHHPFEGISIVTVRELLEKIA
ncbi:MAG: putative toxin-antitoxin system toxin component, PIN family [Ardenticatenaceae bacterium]|nr:putative toxin-antitoxin system toxin component, PIN family [Ardenticatenaceae bacterium]